VTKSHVSQIRPGDNRWQVDPMSVLIFARSLSAATLSIGQESGPPRRGGNAGLEKGY
jgi:hypothetical protein